MMAKRLKLDPIKSWDVFYACYDNVIHIPNLRTREKKSLITYYKTYSITALKKHNVDANHSIIAKKFEEEINNEINKKCWKTTYKEKAKCPNKCNICFFDVKKPFKNDDVQQKDFILDLGLLIVKNNLPLQFVESVWLKCIITKSLGFYN
jgi:hypothetical protein